MQQQQGGMIQKNVAQILTRIQAAQVKAKVERDVRLVAVSKTKTVQEIRAAYDVGIRNFGENYVDEVESKAPLLPNDINWHFIGHLQSNKIKKVLVSNLEYLETLDRESLAEKLQKHLEKNEPERVLKVMIQVKTSEEDSKNGCELPNINALYQFIREKCPALKFKGLMTIGKQGDMSAFVKMVEARAEMCAKYEELREEDFELSMGMSADFETAIEYGSTSVRVGSSIFGARSYPKKEGEKLAEK